MDRLAVGVSTLYRLSNGDSEEVLTLMSFADNVLNENVVQRNLAKSPNYQWSHKNGFDSHMFLSCAFDVSEFS